MGLQVNFQVGNCRKSEKIQKFHKKHKKWPKKEKAENDKKIGGSIHQMPLENEKKNENKNIAISGIRLQSRPSKFLVVTLLEVMAPKRSDLRA